MPSEDKIAGIRAHRAAASEQGSASAAAGTFRDGCPEYVDALLAEVDRLHEAGKILGAAEDRHFNAALRAQERVQTAEREIVCLRTLLEDTVVALEGLRHADLSEPGHIPDKVLMRARLWADKAVKAAREEVPE
jgi:hypothetical protein